MIFPQISCGLIARTPSGIPLKNYPRDSLQIILGILLGTHPAIGQGMLRRSYSY